MPKPTVEQADLILRLFEMRREPEMRRARAYVMHEFAAKTWDEVGYLSGSDPDRYFRMVTSYWEMVANFVNLGILDEDLFFDTQGEGLFVWMRVQAVIPEARQKFRPTYLWNLERMARRQQAWRERAYPTAERVIEEGSKLASSPSRAARRSPAPVKKPKTRRR
ncbi:MAG TPA: hypothetical protein VFP58_06060 [Candidatus Eisenbacteria bacterium]|nr:hypothetical protein [Candidatus Eisenbacteria bacterium]